MLCLDENILLLKLRFLIDMRHAVPARSIVNRNVEQVLILENHFLYYWGKIKKKEKIYPQ